MKVSRYSHFKVQLQRPYSGQMRQLGGCARGQSPVGLINYLEALGATPLAHPMVYHVDYHEATHPMGIHVGKADHVGIYTDLIYNTDVQSNRIDSGVKRWI